MFINCLYQEKRGVKVIHGKNQLDRKRAQLPNNTAEHNCRVLFSVN